MCSVTECSSFLLLRRFHNNSDGRFSQEISLDIAQIFLHAISYFLTHNQSFSKSLVDTLVRDLYHLESLVISRENCCFSSVQEWFWRDGLLSILFDGKEVKNDITEGLIVLVRGIDVTYSEKRLITSKRLKTSFDTVLNNLFHTKLCSNHKKPPVESDCVLMSTILKFCGVESIFSDLNSTSASLSSNVENFFGDYLLIWLIESISIDNKYNVSEIAVRLFFKMLLLCIKAVPELEVFESFLNLLVEGRYHLRRLGNGLEVIAAGGGAAFVQCNALDIFAIEIAEAATFLFHSIQTVNDTDEASENGDVEYLSDMSYFLQVCAGLLDKGTTTLIGPTTVQSWVDIVARTDVTSSNTFKRRNILLDVLLLLGISSTSPFDIDMLSRIVSTALWQGGPTWNSKELKTLSDMKAEVIPNVVRDTVFKLRKELEETPEGVEDLDLYAFLWSER